MDLETVVKIEGYSVEYPEANDNGQPQSDDIKPAVSLTPVPLLPETCGFHQNYDSGSLTAIAFHSEIGTASNCNRIVNAGKSPLTLTKDVKEGSSRKEECSAKEKFKCSIRNCSKSFATNRKLTLHLKFDHRENWLKCHLCEIAFRLKSDLENHLTAHFTAQQYVCNACSSPFKYIRDLRKHERQVHQITYKATLNVSVEEVPLKDIVRCSKSSRKKSSGLKKEEASSEKKFKCSIPNCAKSFADNLKLDAHLKNNHGQNGLFKCNFCKRIWSTKSALETHLISHSTARSHHCNVCSKSFKHIKDLRIHVRKVHQTSLASTEKRELVNHDRHKPNILLKPQSQISRTTTTLNLLDSTNETLEGDLVDPNTALQAPLLKANPTNKCDVCLKAFKSRPALSIHREYVHTAEC